MRLSYGFIFCFSSSSLLQLAAIVLQLNRTACRGCLASYSTTNERAYVLYSWLAAATFLLNRHVTRYTIASSTIYELHVARKKSFNVKATELAWLKERWLLLMMNFGLGYYTNHLIYIERCLA